MKEKTKGQSVLPSELGQIIKKAENDVDKLSKLLDIMDLLGKDLQLFQHSHDCFLPAAREYLRGKKKNDSRFKQARIRRARLGGASRWLYHHQKQTFVGVVGLISPFHIPDYIVDQWWRSIQASESKCLSKARKNA